MAPRRRSGKSVRKAGAAASGRAAAPRDAEIERLERLLAFMREHGLAELEIGSDGRSVRLSKGTAAAPPPVAAPPVGASAASAPAETPGKPARAGEPFLSPMIGTFYRAATPEAKPFVAEGDAVKPDTVICIIEAMKVLNEIKAERGGRIVQILVENGEAVEYGQPLFLIERT